MPGIYIAYRVDTEPLKEALNFINRTTDNSSHIDERVHTTVIYFIRKNENSPTLESVNQELAKLPSALLAETGEITIFDSFTTEGCALVLELNCPELQRIHKSLLNFGLTHNFSPYRPHVSLSYGLSEPHALRLQRECNPMVKGKTVRLHSVYSEILDVNYTL